MQEPTLEPSLLGSPSVENHIPTSYLAVVVAFISKVALNLTLSPGNLHPSSKMTTSNARTMDMSNVHVRGFVPYACCIHTEFSVPPVTPPLYRVRSILCRKFCCADVE